MRRPYTADSSGRALKVLLNYNFKPKDVEDLDFKALFEERRRDSCFAFVFEVDGRVYAVRDHLGTVPLFCTRQGDKLRFATNLEHVIAPDARLTVEGYEAFVGFGTAKLQPLFSNVGLVPPGSVMVFENGRATTVYRYLLRPKRVGGSWSKLTLALEKVLRRAIQRTVRFSRVGLYLGGVWTLR